MKMGLIGCGWIVERGHAPSLQRLPDLEVVTTADPSGDRARRLGRVFGLSDDDCYADYRAILERRDVEIVSIASPPATHREIVTMAAEAGKHVICEKPLATTLVDADAMLAACRRHGVTLAMYHNYLYYPSTVKARELIERKAIGEVLATEISGLGAQPWSGAAEYRPGWRRDVRQAGGGALMDVGVHGFYLTEAFHGHPITAMWATVRYDNTGIDTSAYCQLHVGSGFGMVNVAWGEGDAHVSIMGATGHLSFVYDEGIGYFGFPVRAVRHFAENEPTRTHYMPPVRDMYAPQLYSDLVRGIRGEGPAYPAPGEAGRKALEIALAAYKSAATRELIVLPLPEHDPVYARGLSALHG